MELRIPKELIKYLDSVRGEKSRQAYLVSMLAREMECSPAPKKDATVLKNLIR